MRSSYWQSSFSRRRVLAAGGASALGAAFLAACGGGGSSGAASKGTPGAGASGLVSQSVDTTKDAKKGGTWLSQTNADVVTFDPHFASVPNQQLTQFTYSRLFIDKPGLLQPLVAGVTQGDLAQSYEYSPDKLTLTIKLNPQARWHNLAPVNGRAVDATDVAFSWKRVLAQGSNRQGLANSLNPAAPIEDITAVDPSTVQVKVKFPFPALLTLFASFTAGNLYIVPREADGGFDLRHTQIGSGPLMLTDYTPSASLTYKKHPGYHLPDIQFIDELRLPIVQEYATAMAQFRNGGIYRYSAIRAEDLIPTKKDVSALELYRGDVASTNFTSFFGWNPAYGARTPFRDVRMRQAFSMSWDRDLWLDTVYNVSKFKQQGVDQDVRVNNAVQCSYDGWWVDPRGKDFGPNAKYFNFDLATAKQLVSAAGYPNGVDVDAQYITTSEYGPDFVTQVGIILNFARDAGIRSTTKPVGFATDWRPKIADNQGDFEGLSFRIFPEGITDPPERLFLTYHPDAGILYTGFFSEDSSFRKGDPKLTDMINKARAEFDSQKRISITQDIQRYEAAQMYKPRLPGGASNFSLVWPAVRNELVFHGGLGMIPYAYQWLDATKAPLKS